VSSAELALGEFSKVSKRDVMDALISQDYRAIYGVPKIVKIGSDLFKL